MDKEQDELNTDTDIANDLSAAFDAAEAAETEETTDVGHETVSGDVGGRAEDIDSDTASGQPAADDTGVSGDTKHDPAAGTGAAPAVDEPPRSLPPAAREAWKETPAAMKEAIAKREKDFEAGIMKYAQDAQRAQAIDQTLAPFSQYIAMQGVPVGQTVTNLLATASTLQMGSPAQKAQTVAQLINQFGVDIATLDSLLAGEAVPRGTHDDIDARIQQAVAPFQTLAQQIEQQRIAEQQQTQQRIGTELQQFAAKNEFYQDVAADMADFLDVAAKNGRNMTLEEAYGRACALNPQISQILAARSKEPTPQQQAAASTLRGQGLGGPGSAAAPDDIRGALEAAWGEQGRL